MKIELEYDNGAKIETNSTIDETLGNVKKWLRMAHKVQQMKASIKIVVNNEPKYITIINMDGSIEQGLIKGK